MRLNRHLIILAVLGSISCNQQSGNVSVLKVIDGDTVHFLIDSEVTKVRIACIDAPETAQSGGGEAKAALQSLLVGRLKITEHGKDMYGRTLGSISADNADIGRSMVRRGWAWAYPKCGILGAEYLALQERARSEKLGLWGRPGAVAPWDYRKEKRLEHAQ